MWRNLKPLSRTDLELYRQESLASKTALWGILALPFQQALTVDVGFPIKISEILFAVAIAAKILEFIRGRHQYSLRRIIRDPTVIAVGLIAITLTASAIVAAVSADLTEAIPGVSRSAYIDLALYVAYGAFALSAWLVLRDINHHLFVNILVLSLWLCGAAVVLQMVARMFTPLSPLLTSMGFAMDRWGANIGGTTFLRNGPFLEGQHLGFYAGGLIVLTLFAGRYISAAVAIACAIYSMSTTAFIAVALTLLITIISKPSKKLLLAAASGIIAAGVLISSVPPLRDAFLFQLSKLNLFGLGDPARTVSLGVRSAKTEIGWRMILDHPIGVAPGRFGVHFHDYVDSYTVFSDYIRNGEGRAIAENVYIQVGSELGVVGVIALIALIGTLLYRTWLRDRATFSMVLFVSIGIVTQSSWTFLPIWVFLGLGASLIIRSESEPDERAGNFPAASPRRAYRLQNGNG